MADNSELAAAMIEAKEAAEPIFESAEGVKADLIKRGWSEEAAEAVGLEWLLGFIRKVWG